MNSDLEEKHLNQLFAKIFNSHYPAVKHFAHMLLRSEEDAEDIAQDVFSKLWQRPDLWSEDEDINSYLYVMTRNFTFNFIKHQKIEKSFQQQMEAQNQIEEYLKSESLLDSIYYKESLLFFQLVLEQLPKRRKEIFIMSRLKKMTHNEIAQKLNISVRTVESQVYLAIKKMKEVFSVLFFYFLFK